MRELNHVELEPIERLVAAVADLEPLTIEYANGPDVSLGPSVLLNTAIAMNEIEIFSHALCTGATQRVDPEMVTGRNHFHPVFESSALLFGNVFEPYGGNWPSPALPLVRAWVKHWRSCYGLDESTEAIEEVLAGWHATEGDALVVETPVFMVTIRRSDFAEAEAFVRQLHRRQCGDDVSTVPKRERPLVGPRGRELLVENATLTSAEVGIIVERAENTMRKWRSAGKGPPFHKYTPGRSGGVYYLPDEVEAWLRAQQGWE